MVTDDVATVGRGPSHFPRSSCPSGTARSPHGGRGRDGAGRPPGNKGVCAAPGPPAQAEGEPLCPRTLRELLRPGPRGASVRSCPSVRTPLWTGPLLTAGRGGRVAWRQGTGRADQQHTGGEAGRTACPGPAGVGVRARRTSLRAALCRAPRCSAHWAATLRTWVTVRPFRAPWFHCGSPLGLARSPLPGLFSPHCARGSAGLRQVDEGLGGRRGEGGRRERRRADVWLLQSQGIYFLRS